MSSSLNLLRKIRKFVETQWPMGDSFEMCDGTSLLITKILGRGRLNGGGDQPGRGYRDKHGMWHNHMWVELDVDDKVFIVDLTADQFGGPKVVLVPAPDIRYQPNVAGASLTLTGLNHLIESLLKKWTAKHL